MHYENRQPPEGINVDEHGWARDFILLVIGFFAGLALVCWLLLQLVAWGAKWTPFAWEQSLTSPWQASQASDPKDVYLQQLADSLAQAGGLSPELTVTVHSMHEQTINAFATLGGNMVVVDGLLDAVETEQGLAFVIAHEIAHIQYRHPIQAVARGLSLSLVTALIFGQTDLSQIAGFGGNLALLTYSRQQENEADAWALAAVNNLYGHVAGADELFRRLQKDDASKLAGTMPEWLSTHPDLRARIARLHELAQAQGFAEDGETSPLPNAVKRETADSEARTAP